MRIIFTLLTIALLAACALAQDVSALPNGRFYADTLTATVDTVDVGFNDVWGITDVTVSIYSASVDTVTASVLSYDGQIWTQTYLTDLSSGSDVTQMVVGTTPKEFLIVNPHAWIIRLMTTDAEAGAIFCIQGKTYGSRK